MIGSAQEAQIAVFKHEYNKRPRGWHKVGEGISRKAYLSPTGVVYKVEHDGEYGSNVTEHEAFRRYRRWKSLPKKGVFIPESTLYIIGGEPVIAVEYIKKTASTWCNRFHWHREYPCSCKPLTRPNRMCYADLTEWLEYKGMNDMHSDNLFRRDDQLFVIDLGYN